MNKKIVFQYTVLTFVIMLILWGLCIVFGQFGITLNEHKWLFLPFLLGGFSPAIASFLILRKNNEVKNLKEWLKNVFNFKSSVCFYLIVIILSTGYFVPQVIINGLQEMNPFYLFFILLPLMLFGGGMEEAGWRYILQPELDKKYGFIISSIIVAVIWSVWHIPLFFIPDCSQYGTDFWLFSIDVFGLAFALGAIRKISNNVFLCILYHCIHNAGSVTFNINDTLLGNGITSGLLIIISIIIVFIYKYIKIDTIK